jgi:hypothetical protein
MPHKHQPVDKMASNEPATSRHENPFLVRERQISRFRTRFGRSRDSWVFMLIEICDITIFVGVLSIGLLIWEVEAPELGEGNIVLDRC